jgi:hypothetical protein
MLPQETEGACDVIGDGLVGQPEARGDLGVGKAFLEAEVEDLLAAGRKVADGVVERFLFHDGFGEVGRGTGFEFDLAGLLGVNPALAALAEIDRETAGRDKKEGAEVVDRVGTEGLVGAEEGVVGDVLGFGTVVEKAREVGSEGGERRLVERRELALGP